MGHTVNVRAISVLTEQRTALLSFAYRTKATLDRAEMQIRQTEEHLKERMRAWTSEVQRRTQDVARAQSALYDCMHSGSEENPPNCSKYMQELEMLQRLLKHAQEQVYIVGEAQKVLNQAAGEYRTEAQRLRSLLQGEVPRGIAFLEQKRGELEAYLATNLVAGAAGAALGGIGFAAGTIAEIVRGAGATAPEPAETDEEAIAITDMASLEARAAQQRGWTAASDQADWDTLAVQHAEHEHAAERATPSPQIGTPPDDGHRSGHPETGGSIEGEPGPEAMEGGPRRPEGVR